MTDKQEEHSKKEEESPNLLQAAIFTILQPLHIEAYEVAVKKVRELIDEEVKKRYKRCYWCKVLLSKENFGKGIAGKAICKDCFNELKDEFKAIIELEELEEEGGDRI